MSTTRRVFLLTLSATGAAMSPLAGAQPKLLDEKDPQAAALGYVADAARVDVRKYPKYAAGQLCANCALYQAPPTAPSGPCTIFPGRHVAAKGWCSAWVKRG